MQRQVIEGYRLSPQQKRLWLLHESSDRAPLICTLLIEGELDAPRLTAALGRLVARHEVLRTGFERLPGMDYPVQVIGAARGVRVEAVDLRGIEDAGARQEVARQWAEAGEGEQW